VIVGDPDGASTDGDRARAGADGDGLNHPVLLRVDPADGVVEFVGHPDSTLGDRDCPRTAPYGNCLDDLILAGSIRLTV
jgi:hypothetical protein